MDYELIAILKRQKSNNITFFCIKSNQCFAFQYRRRFCDVEGGILAIGLSEVRSRSFDDRGIVQILRVP